MRIEENVTLAPWTTLKIGGSARFFARATSEAELVEAIGFARARGLEVFALGGGSNVLVSDAGFAGLVIHMAIGAGIEFEGDRCRVDAGVDWDQFVLRVCERRLSGVECLAGIPGMVGGSPIQNIGAYGQEVASTIERVRVLDLQTMRFVELAHAECGFAYRTSIFNTTARGRYLVTAVTFRFEAGEPKLSYADLRKYFGEKARPSPLEIYAAVREIRAGKGMLIDPANLGSDARSAGSFFKNPVVRAGKVAEIAGALGMEEAEVPRWEVDGGAVKLPAAWLIERAGFGKGYASSEESAVGISTRHTLALVNRSGTATCEELVELRDLIVAGVESRFGVSLEQEPVMVGSTA